MTVRMTLDLDSMADYRKFLAVKSLPRFSFEGRTAIVPDEYSATLGMKVKRASSSNYTPNPRAFDYQRDITEMSIDKRKFATFADCGLGKTLMLLDYAYHVLRHTPKNKKVLIVSPLMVIRQTVKEAGLFFGGELPIEVVKSTNINQWLDEGTGRLGITNYEAMNVCERSDNLVCLILDESSMLKSNYGRWASTILKVGAGLEWKLALTGTPAPNDRIEYANHAVFMDRFPNVKAFLATFFINRGQTENRWELKAHALKPFYKALADWSIFLVNPKTYGWSELDREIPPLHVYTHHVSTTKQQRELVQGETGDLIPVKAGGIKTRGMLSQVAKGCYRGQNIDSNKPEFIRGLVDQWPDEQTIIWCWYNSEQDRMTETFPEAASMSGDTPDDKRQEMIAEFQDGRRRILISKPKILGFGLNLQCCTRQVFSGLVDSYEAYYQAVKRSNRYGSTRPLNVHLPITDLEAPMVDSVLRKCKMVQEDSIHQEAIFRDAFANR